MPPRLRWHFPCPLPYKRGGNKHESSVRGLVLPEPEGEPLVSPKCRKRLEADQLAYCEVDRLQPGEDYLNNIWSNEGEWQDAADLTVIDTNVACEASNG